MKDIAMVPKTRRFEPAGEVKQPGALERLQEIPSLAWAAAGVVAVAIAGTLLGVRYARA